MAEFPVEIFACGAGKKAECCIYMMIGASGACCQRETDLGRTAEAAKTQMTAQRQPTEPFPDCQKWDKAGNPKPVA